MTEASLSMAAQVPTDGMVADPSAVAGNNPGAIRRLIAAGALAGAVLIAGCTTKLSEAQPTGNDDQTEQPSAPGEPENRTPGEVADSAECADPSNTDAMIFAADGKPLLGIEAGREVSAPEVVATIEAKVCTETEATTYYTEVNRRLAFDNVANISTEPRQSLFDRIRDDETVRDQVGKNVVDFLEGTGQSIQKLDEIREPEMPLYNLRYRAETNSTYAQPLEETGVAVIRLAQRAGGDTDLEVAEDDTIRFTGGYRYIRAGHFDEQGNVVADADTGTIVVTNDDLQDCPVEPNAVPVPDANPETSIPASGEQTDGNNGSSRGPKGKSGGNSGNKGNSGNGGNGGGGGDGCGECGDGGGDDIPEPTAPPTTKKPPVTVPPTAPPTVPPTSPPTTKPPEPPRGGEPN